MRKAALGKGENYGSAGCLLGSKAFHQNRPKPGMLSTVEQKKGTHTFIYCSRLNMLSSRRKRNVSRRGLKASLCK